MMNFSLSPSSVLSESEKRCLLRIARHSIEVSVTKRGKLLVEEYEGALAQPAGVFVTLRERNDLRGCIGYIDTKKPLSETVGEAAARSALGDPRFHPVTPDELLYLEIEISVLSELKRIRSESEIEIGTHGLVVDAGGHRGLLLPQVAVEYGWNAETFLQQTLRKAGLPAKARDEKGFSMYVFTAEVFDEHSLPSEKIP